MLEKYFITQKSFSSVLLSNRFKIQSTCQIPECTTKLCMLVYPVLRVLAACTEGQLSWYSSRANHK